MLNMVIVGTAHMHSNEIALYIHRHPGAKLCGVSDLVPAAPENTDARYTRAWNLKNIEESCGARVFSDYRAMLDEVRPDLTFILCENDRKTEAAMECIRRGLAFSLEKPMAMTYEEAGAIAGAAREAGVTALVNWPVIWRPYVNRFMKAVEARLCGNPLKLEYSNGHTGPLGKGARHRGVTAQAEEMDDATRARTWWYQEARGGGVFLDMMCYGSLYARWILGDGWKKVTAMGMNLATPCSDCADNAAAIVEYPDKLAVLGGTWTTPNRFMASGPAVICEGGVIWCAKEADGTPTVRAMDIYGNDVPVPEYEQDEALTDMVCNYVSHVEKGTPIHTPAQLSMNLQVMSLLDACIRSAREGRQVEAGKA